MKRDSKRSGESEDSACTRIWNWNLSRRWNMRLKDYMVRNDNDEEGFKKERGVRGQCLYTYLELESKSTKAAIEAVHNLAGWEDLSQADSRYAALDEAYNKHNDKVKQRVDPIEEAQGLNEIEPVKNKIIDIKEYQRDMTMNRSRT